MMSEPRIDTNEVRIAARGHWHSILPALTGIDAQLLDSRNHPCPRCGGRDRYRAFDDFDSTGGMMCNQCFRNGSDGFSAIMWLRGITFGEALREVAECLNMVERNGPQRTYSVPFDAKSSPQTAEKKPPTAYHHADYAKDVLRAVMERDGLVQAGQWTYRDQHSKPVAYVLRFNRPDGTKEFRPLSKHGEFWYIKGPPIPRLLYNLPCLSVGKTCWVVEGEKAADAAFDFGLLATTSMNGSQSPEKTDWTPLRGKRVIILPDNDEPGMSYALAVATILSGLNCDVRIVNLPGLPHGGDIADWGGSREELLKLCNL